MFKFIDLLILVPSIIGLFFYKNIDKSYRLFILYLLAGSITELAYYFGFKQNEYKFFIFIYILIATQLLLTIFMKWDRKKTHFKTKLLFHFVFLLIYIVDLIIIFKYENNMRWGQLFLYLVLSIYAINILNQNTEGLLTKKSAYSRLLIIVPFVIFTIYYCCIRIIMFYLYNAKNEEFFSNLYNTVRVINALSYLCYSLAIIWAPKEEQYLTIK